MLKNENIICISSIDWDFIWQGHQEIMSTFARDGNRVLFIENTGVRAPRLRDVQRLKKRIVDWLKSIKGFRKVADNLYVYSPLILPFPYSRFMRWVNKPLLIRPLIRWMKAMQFHANIVWTFLPTGTALDIIDKVDGKLLVYYCIADFYELADSPGKIKKTEDQLMRKSDIIFAQGEVLAKKCRQLNDNVHIFPFGVKIEAFEKSFKNTPDDIKRIKKPIIGYVGGIHRHIDFELMRLIAESHPEWSVVLIGPVQADVSKIDGLNNVFLLGQKDFLLLPSYINQFNVGIIPYRMSGYMETVFPTKLNEYHAMGKAVISTNLPEITKFNDANDNLVLIAKTHQEFLYCILRALKETDADGVRRRIASSRKHSWSARIEEMGSLLEESLERKAKMPGEWQEAFLKLYRRFRRKTIKTATIFLATYLLLFYTPFAWFIAKPLKITQPPEKVDCIIVFAGGVGESGMAGDGYEERVEYASELYKEGYAKHIIFSSGYTYVFKEPLLMKALALALGIPEEAIILEDKAANTYQNVKFVKAIIDKKGWKQVLFISSPYHMRRISLVVKKAAPEIKSVYAPIPASLFYSHDHIDRKGRRVWKQVTLPQIRAILHEYMGILYYHWKGWI